MNYEVNRDPVQSPPDSSESGGLKKHYKCNRVIPTERDFALLNDLYHHVVLSLTQLKARNFLEQNKCTMLNRLKRLEEGGLLKRFRVSNFRDVSGEHDIGTVFQITRSGIATLQNRYPSQLFRSHSPSISFQSLQHDLTVNEVQWRLTKRFPQIKFTNGRLVDCDEKNVNLPDIVGDKIAVEVELTAKSEKRYRELLLNYQVMRKYESIIYVTGNDSIKRKVQDCLLGYRRNARTNHNAVDTGSIYFVDLKTMLANPDGAQITNGVQEFNFKPRSV